jgi:outer membrane protein OmpA-like peptidoglycan-associated protein
MSSRQTSNWISLSDMMTGLMLIFLLIAVLTISQVVAQEKERQQMITEYDLSKEEIYSDLEKAFGGKKDDWGIEIARDLSIKFQNPDLLFDSDDSNLKDNYKQILEDFIPRYLAIVNKEEYKDRIREVRIEGHTAEVSPAHPTYMSTISLSQNRANSVLAFMLENPYYLSLGESDKAKLLFWFTANGLGKGRTLDFTGEYTFKSGQTISQNSRRVEFRIVTTSEELIEEIISKQKLTN